MAQKNVFTYVFTRDKEYETEVIFHTHLMDTEIISAPMITEWKLRLAGCLTLNFYGNKIDFFWTSKTGMENYKILM